MTEYERGYTDGYKDGLHKYMPEVPSIPIPSLDAKSAKPAPGDVVAWPNPPHGHVMIGLYGRDWTSDIGLVVLLRAAEVKRLIGEGQ